MLPSSRALLLVIAGCAGSREPPVGEIGTAAVLEHARVLAVESQLPRWSAAVPAALLVGLSIAAWLATRGAPCDGESFRRHRGLACEIAGE